MLGGGETLVPPEPVQVQWPQTVAVIFNPSSGGDSASEWGDRIRQAIQKTGKKLIWLETTPEDSGQGLTRIPVRGVRLAGRLDPDRAVADSARLRLTRWLHERTGCLL